MSDRHHVRDFVNTTFHLTMLLRICSASIACLTWLSTCSFPTSHLAMPHHLAGILPVGVLVGTPDAKLGGVFVEKGLQSVMLYMRGDLTRRAATMSVCSRTAYSFAPRNIMSACSFCRRRATVSSSTGSARLQPNHRMPPIEPGKCTEVAPHGGLLCILNTTDEFGNAGGDVDCSDAGDMASVSAGRSQEVPGWEKCSLWRTS